MNSRNLAAAALIAMLIATVARADVQIGAKPQLQFADFNTHKPIKLTDFKGKIVVIDFWATWCGSCMGEAAHMVAVNEKYESKGLQFLGISLDEDPSSLKKVIAEKNFTWPQSYEGRGWDGPTPKAWGVNSIPQTFIIGPDGDVLWRGHPANIDAGLESAFKDHPPQLVDTKVLLQAQMALDQVEKSLSDQQPTKAIKQLANVPEEAKADAGITARVKDATDKLQEFGNSELTGIDPMIQSGQYASAIQKLRDLSQAFAGTPVSASAKAKLTQLGSDPKVKQVLEQAKTEKAAADALALARQLQAEKKDDLAYPQFKIVVQGYPHTPAANEAVAAVKAYESDTAFMTAFSNKINKKKAEALLMMADNYRSMGSSEKAKAKYQQVLDLYPNTTWADVAKKGLTAVADSQ